MDVVDLITFDKNHNADAMDESKALADPNILDELRHEVNRLDYILRSVEAETEGLSLYVPEGLPMSHWWFRLTGCSGTPMCWHLF